VPQLGSQIYTMAGMETHLNLLADKPGRVSRHLRPITAATGFADMRFNRERRVARRFIVDRTGTRRRIIARPRPGTPRCETKQAVPPATFGSVEGNLFERNRQ